MSMQIDQTASSSSGSAALRTLLITDFVSSTELIETLGDKRAAKIFTLHDRRARDLLAIYQGVEIDKTDGFLFLFTRPIDAVRFSLSYHDMLRSLCEETKTTLEARAGIHVGEVILRRNSAEDVARGAKPVEVDGLSKHAAARVMSVAVAGQTLMTGTTYAFAKRGAVGETDLPEDVCWVCHGEFMLKGIDEPVPLHEVGREGIAPLHAPPDSEKVRRVAEVRGPRSRFMWLSGTLAVVVLAAVSIQVFQSLNAEPVQERRTLVNTPDADPTVADPDAVESSTEPALPATIKLSVDSEPAGAKISIDGSWGQAPFIKTPSARSPRQISSRAAHRARSP
jgi:class 3 adenylate cyclase